MNRGELQAVNILRFACGAVSRPFEVSFQDWVGRRRHDGRYRVIAYDLDGRLVMPRMPGGRPAPRSSMSRRLGT